MAIRASNLFKFDSDGNWKPIHSSVFFNPFKFKRGRRRESKNTQHTKKKVKGIEHSLWVYMTNRYVNTIIRLSILWYIPVMNP